MTAHEMPPTRKRRQTARGKATRERILAATIECIVGSGFSSLAVEAVIAKAQVSRGSILHQFPTRVDLAVAAAQNSLETILDEIAADSARFIHPYERLLRHAEVLWATMNRPAGLALMEILQAARWDEELGTALKPMIAEREQGVRKALVEIASEAGMPDPEQYISRGWLLVSTIRGLIIERGFNPDRAIITAAIEDMLEAHRRYCERMVPSGKQIQV